MLITRMVTWPKIISQIQGRGRTHTILKIVFGYISQRHVVRLTRNSGGGRWSRIACSHRSHDQNCKFRKLKMAADCHHFEKVLYISAAINPILMKFGLRMRILILIIVTWRKSKFCKRKTADGRHLESRFWLLSQRHVVQSNAKFGGMKQMQNHIWPQVSIFLAPLYIFVVDLRMQFKKINCSKNCKKKLDSLKHRKDDLSYSRLHE